MVKRRMIRALVVYSKTFYFIDRGAPHGTSYDTLTAFEAYLNRKLKRRHLRVHVVFIPVARDQLLPALLQGRGDIAAANLTITPARKALVDFSDPFWSGISELLVTGPSARDDPQRRGPLGQEDPGARARAATTSTWCGSTSGSAREGKPPRRASSWRPSTWRTRTCWRW